MSESISATMSRSSSIRRYLGRPFLNASEWLWCRLPPSFKATRPMYMYGSLLHSLVKLRSSRMQFHGTFFFRNRPELEMMRSLADQKAKGDTLKIAVLACSNGAEVYSILWTLRTARPDLKIKLHAVDISSEIVEVAKAGLYSPQTPDAKDLVTSAIFDRIAQKELQGVFDPENGNFRIKPWLKEGIEWQAGDAADPMLVDALGEQDIVVANKFLCHMPPASAEKCLRNLVRLVRPLGYLFVSGVDLEVRTKVALDLGWTPVRELIEEMHDGDPSVRGDWPWQYWGLEPFDRKRQDWSIRYASVFQIGVAESAAQPQVSLQPSVQS